jgi:hypothetical protein
VGGERSRVLRGGAWNNESDNLRAANRNNDNPDNRDNNIGFRLVCAGVFVRKVLLPAGSQTGEIRRAQTARAVSAKKPPTAHSTPHAGKRRGGRRGR